MLLDSMVEFCHQIAIRSRSPSAIRVFRFTSASKQLICCDLDLFHIKSQKFLIESQIKLRSFESNAYRPSSNRISKSQSLLRFTHQMRQQMV